MNRGGLAGEAHEAAPVAFAEGAHEGREAHTGEGCAAAVIRRQRETQGVDAHAALATLAVVVQLVNLRHVSFS